MSWHDIFSDWNVFKKIKDTHFLNKSSIFILHRLNFLQIKPSDFKLNYLLFSDLFSDWYLNVDYFYNFFSGTSLFLSYLNVDYFIIFREPGRTKQRQPTRDQV
jgi:hypothetical protein